jgi:D-alanyl-D-alanine carboxypeptidase/D-alanyl-D-alanine-endopeptidase (penicillin-binding protein 4)
VVVAMVNSTLVGNGKGRKVLDALVDWVARSGTAETTIATVATVAANH